MKEMYFKKKGSLLLPRIVASGAIMALLCSAAPQTVSAEGKSASEARTSVESTESTYNVNKDLYFPGVIIEDGKISYDLAGISSKKVSSYTAYSVTVDGRRLSSSALMINSTLYLPARAFLEALGAKVSYNSRTKTLTATANGFNLSAADGGFVTYVNDRPLFAFSPNAVMSNGRMYIPASTLVKATGTSINKVSTSVSSVDIKGKLSPIAHASSYYRDDEVFWLARIITAEARGESLLGQIAVGNVIVNRVKSNSYPNTIYGVIFDRKWGVQFSPVLDGTIYNTPTYNATLAAKIILEGTTLSENSLFFLNPKTAESNWIVKSREYQYTIGGHDFYA